MRLLLAKACEYATTQQSGRQTMIGMFENIASNEFPFEHPPLFFCLQMEFEPLDQGRPLQLQVILIDEDGKTIYEAKAGTEIPREEQLGVSRLYVQFMVPPIRFEKPGQYRFDISANGEKVGEERLPVLEIPRDTSWPKL